jgi:hypothetical protein
MLGFSRRLESFFGEKHEDNRQLICDETVPA